MQTQKWVNLGLLAVSVLTFLFLNQLLATVWGVARLPVNEGLPLEPSQIAAFVITAGLAFWTRKYQRANTFFNEVVLELSKVTWPHRKETIGAATVVVFLVAIATMILFMFDQIWRVAMRGALSL